MFLNNILALLSIKGFLIILVKGNSSVLATAVSSELDPCQGQNGANSKTDEIREHASENANEDGNDDGEHDASGLVEETVHLVVMMVRTIVVGLVMRAMWFLAMAEHAKTVVLAAAAFAFHLVSHGFDLVGSDASPLT
jgi:hypothetical protein